jgi:hypothetical protein
MSSRALMSIAALVAAMDAIGPLGRGLIVGLGSSAIGTPVERKTRFTLLLHLPRMSDHGHKARVKNGPVLAGYSRGGRAPMNGF